MLQQTLQMYVLSEYFTLYAVIFALFSVSRPTVLSDPDCPVSHESPSGEKLVTGALKVCGSGFTRPPPPPNEVKLSWIKEFVKTHDPVG